MGDPWLGKVGGPFSAGASCQQPNTAAALRQGNMWHVLLGAGGSMFGGAHSSHAWVELLGPGIVAAILGRCVFAYAATL